MQLSLGQFCPPGQNLTFNFWTEKGMSPCLTETIVSSTSVLYMLVFGSMQLLLYKRYATPVQHYVLPYSQLYGLQVVLNGSVSFLCFMRLLVELFVFKSGVMYGYMILVLLQAVIAWPMVLLLLVWERRYMLPSPPSRGHGIILLLYWTFMFAMQNLILLNMKDDLWFFEFKNFQDVISFSLFLARYMCTFGIFLLGLRAPGIPSIRHSDSFARLHLDGEAEEGQNIAQGSPFRNLWKKMKMLAPFVWPSKSLVLQLCVTFSVLLLILGRLTNIFVPLYSKKIVDSMTIYNTTVKSNSWMEQSFAVGPYGIRFRWDYILIYVALKVVQGGGAGGTGLLNNVRSLLWISVEQFTTREVQVKFFEHLHGLSLRWHLQRKTGEVLRAMDRGTDSINNILNYLLFSILPTIADIIIAIVYFTMFFNWIFGLIVFITMILYLACTFIITEWRTKFRRTMNLADNEQRQQAIDSLLNFETVKYYANEAFEADRYASSIIKYQKEEWKVTASVALLNFIQLILINAGLLIGSLYCVWLVISHDPNTEGLTVGDYVMFTAYLMQLYAPLNYFGTYYRMLQKCFIDMENMLDLFKEVAEVKDLPDAPDLHVTNGVVEFRNVNFSYVPEKQILNNVSFVVPAGSSVALVGPSGGGKSTIIRLLFRFYDPTMGDIFIDGQNIKKIAQTSLRKAVGVVPQDTVLFNDTIKYNILYGRIGAEEEHMFKASQAACIHDKIMTFPDRYDSKVGERGLKLSGGEKQRVAIARTILKNPNVILLDEATSALDTHTERQIQSSLQLLCADRTSVIVAHRLSTIVHCNQILVIQDGSIVEGGTHEQLLSQNGVYASMWNEQAKHGDSEESGGASVEAIISQPEQ